jgi:7,8-dihydropterin-6-yl-methyl-4-(beta-D-ribofuranosyl)aminobenzene 5'-phosphate synthase
MKTVSGRITILTDNVAQDRSETVAEHGFSAYIETDNGNLLFDTGKGRTVVHNACIFNKDLDLINKVILSHSHGDHTGGLPDVLLSQSKKPLDIYAHPDIFLYRYRKKNGKKTYGGIPFTQGYLEKMGARFVFNTDYVEVEPGVFLTGEVPRKTPFEGGDMADRFAVRDGKEEPETIPDDQSLVIHTEKGLLLVLGCAHAGIINVIEHVLAQSGLKTIFAVIGGTHIGFSGEVQLSGSIEALKSYGIRQLIPSHCTGLEAIFRIKQAFEDSFQFSHVGFQLEF